jgi:hypothetical protein
LREVKERPIADKFIVLIVIDNLMISSPGGFWLVGQQAPILGYPLPTIRQLSELGQALLRSGEIPQ